jgi:hypothetical protein
MRRDRLVHEPSGIAATHPAIPARRVAVSQASHRTELPCANLSASQESRVAPGPASERRACCVNLPANPCHPQPSPGGKGRRWRVNLSPNPCQPYRSHTNVPLRLASTCRQTPASRNPGSGEASWWLRQLAAKPLASAAGKCISSRLCVRQLAAKPLSSAADVGLSRTARLRQLAAKPLSSAAEIQDANEKYMRQLAAKPLSSAADLP